MNVSFESLLSGGGIISSLPKTKHGIYVFAEHATIKTKYHFHH
mgnify:CR=1 FL=1